VIILGLFPFVTVALTKQSETDENGNKVKSPWNPNDSLGMTRYTLPIFTRELNGIYQDLKTNNLYTYAGQRLELNEEVASKVRRVFMVGNTTVELSAVVILQPDESRVEGIKMKFNNEQSSVLLTLNDIEALTMALCNMDIDSVALLMYLNYITKPTLKPYTPETLNTNVDIAPLKGE
jgi:hypothetical protein